MTLTYEISEEELQVFLDESEEQIHVLEDGLVRLEQDGKEPELISAMFRAAHTLKGSGGLVGHRPLTDLTHSIENAFDALRKDAIDISTELTDVCLESIDMLRQFCEDVSEARTSNADVSHLTDQLEKLIGGSTIAPLPGPAKNRSTLRRRRRTCEDSFLIQAVITEGSAASAARAFQLMLALQDCGEIVRMEPSQEQIETAQPIHEFMAELIPSRPIEDIQASLLKVDDVELLSINGKSIRTLEPEMNVSYKEPLRLGDYLISLGLISSADLDAALKAQSSAEGESLPIGRILVRNKALTQEALDKAVAGQVEELRSALKAVKEEQPRQPQIISEKTIRTSIERLDSLMNLVGEMVTDRNRLERIRIDVENHLRGDPLLEDFTQTISHFGRISDQLQEEVMAIRMQPVARVFNKLPRLIRDLARKNGKQIDLVLEGSETEMDRTVIEKIGDPLIHLLRNAADHGIETPEEREASGKPPRGKVRIRARHENGQILIDVEDDGRGIAADAVKQSAIERGFISADEAEGLDYDEAVDLIFRSGLSTARVVNDISGRGVGMDIVRSNVEKLGGSIMVESWPGMGTRFQLIMPLTLAIMPTLLVCVDSRTYAIPLVSVTRTLRVPSETIQTIKNRPTILVEGKILPLVSMREAFAIPEVVEDSEYKHIVAIRLGKTRVGVIVDAFIGEESVMVKPLGMLTGHVQGVSGAAILGDGQIALIADIQGVIKLVHAGA